MFGVVHVVDICPRTSLHDRSRHDEPFSKNSFASFTLVAKYGLPPRSGWFSSISVRCALRILSLVMARSLSPTSASGIAEEHEVGMEIGTYLRDNIRDASRLFIRGSKPPL